MGMVIRFGHVELRQFTPADTRELYCIRNHPTVRPNMANPALIPYKSHLAWVRDGLLADPDFLLFLVRTGRRKRAIGLTQLRCDGDTAEIGVIFRDAQRHGVIAGLSTVVTLHLAFAHLGHDFVISYVLPDHRAARAYNSGFGADEVESDRPGMIKFHLPRDVCQANKRFRGALDRIKDRLQITQTPDCPTPRAPAPRSPG